MVNVWEVWEEVWEKGLGGEVGEAVDLGDFFVEGELGVGGGDGVKGVGGGGDGRDETG